ncbi:hypothetical protein LINPERHAP2_LOCUS41834 [Linum perenne]
MTLLSSQNIKRIQFQRWGKRIGSSFTASSSSSSSAAAGAVAIGVGMKRKGPLGWCCSRSYVPNKWVYKFKAQWKKTIGWKKSSTTTPSQYSYDIQSYSLNFDDGNCR